MARDSVHPFWKNVRRITDCYRFVIGLALSTFCLALIFVVGTPPISRTFAIEDTPAPTASISTAPPATAAATEGISPEIILLLFLSAIALLTLPLGYFLFSR